MRSPDGVRAGLDDRTGEELIAPERGCAREPGSDILRRSNAIGFNTYGEQFCGVHVNQTLTAIALGFGSATDSAEVDDG